MNLLRPQAMANHIIEALVLDQAARASLGATDAIEWIASDRLETCCEALEVDPGQVRAVVDWLRARPVKSGGAAVLQLPGLSVREMAQRSGLPRSTLHRWMKRERAA